jgi:hypothetical protein
MASGVHTSIQQGATGGGSTPMKDIGQVWGMLKETGPDRTPDFYEWEEVRPDQDGKWHKLADDNTLAKPPHDSTLVGDVLLNPAVEVNGITAPLDTVFRMTPTELFSDMSKQLTGPYDEPWLYRVWYFSVDQRLRPFRLKEDMIPARIMAPGGPIVPQTSVQAEWLDMPDEDDPDKKAFTLYPPHLTGWPAGDDFLSFGIGRGPSGHFRGTYGWARWEPKATILGWEPGGDGVEEVWRGEWQIVTIYAETIEELEVDGTARIEHGKDGPANVWWFNKDTATNQKIDSGYNVKFHNDLFTDVAPGDFIQNHYDRNRAIWVAFGYPIPSGITLYQSSSQATTAAFAVLEFDTVMTDTDGDDLIFGLHIARDDHEIKNTSDRDIVGIASWQVCAERDLDPAPAVPGPDAYCEVGLYNDGNLVTGTTSRLTSSRRRLPTPPELASQMGPKAVNTSSGSVTCRIKPGEVIEIRLHHALHVDANDHFNTVADSSHFTFMEIQGARQGVG